VKSRLIRDKHISGTGKKSSWTVDTRKTKKDLGGWWFESYGKWIVRINVRKKWPISFDTSPVETSDYYDGVRAEVYCNGRQNIKKYTHRWFTIRKVNKNRISSHKSKWQQTTILKSSTLTHLKLWKKNNKNWWMWTKNMNQNKRNIRHVMYILSVLMPILFFGKYV